MVVDASSSEAFGHLAAAEIGTDRRVGSARGCLTTARYPHQVVPAVPPLWASANIRVRGIADRVAIDFHMPIGSPLVAARAGAQSNREWC